MFLFIIWSTAYYKKDRILEDIYSDFNVLKTIEITWTKEKFSDNLSRFYGQKLTKQSFKEKACGNAPFTLVVFEDQTPVYSLRKTSRGEDEKVNVNTFDKKNLYRKWTTEGERNIHSKIHGTNSPEETEHDLTLLLGLSPEDFKKRYQNIPYSLCCDLVGANGWETISQLFYILNHTTRYCFLRNFEGIPDSFQLGSHADIDLLCDDFEGVRRICNAVTVFKDKNRVQCLCTVSGINTQFDFRYVGDGYYDKNWEKAILDHRKLNKGYYIPHEQDYKYMLLYHALIHKLSVASDYIERLDSMFGKDNWGIECLKKYMNENNYSFTEPRDLSVYFNLDISPMPVSYRRRTKMSIIHTKKIIRRIVEAKRGN